MVSQFAECPLRNFAGWLHSDRHHQAPHFTPDDIRPSPKRDVMPVYEPSYSEFLIASVLPLAVITVIGCYLCRYRRHDHGASLSSSVGLLPISESIRQNAAQGYPGAMAIVRHTNANSNNNSSNSSNVSGNDSTLTEMTPVVIPDGMAARVYQSAGSACTAAPIVIAVPVTITNDNASPLPSSSSSALSTSSVSTTIGAAVGQQHQWTTTLTNASSSSPDQPDIQWQQPMYDPSVSRAFTHIHVFLWLILSV
jgi:hypothetical protein